nr:ABC transporter permease [Woeseiaceae bacterium]
MQFERRPRYWINPDSRKGYFAELALLESDRGQAYMLEKSQIEGEAIRYVDWVLPGILGMNMMFSSLFGVGYVVVRYRKNG